jgi:glycosyltransferase
MPPHPTLYIRREWYLMIGGFDPSFKISADYLSIIQLFSRADFKSVYLPRVFIKMRLGGKSNKSIKNIITKSKEDLRALKSTKQGAFLGYGALLWKNLSKVIQYRFF